MCGCAGDAGTGEATAEDHPLKNDYRPSVTELTDRETYTVLHGVKVTGAAKRHWRFRHKETNDLIEATVLPKAILESIYERRGTRKNTVWQYAIDMEGKIWRAVLGKRHPGK
jgi:hypothetical protein